MFDTIREAFHHVPHLDLRLDTRNSFISNKAAKIFGIKVGLEFNDIVKTGISFNLMLIPFEKAKIVSVNNIIDTVQARLRFAYGSIYFEYVFYHRNNWSLSIPVQLGFGLAGYTYRLQEEQQFEPLSPVIIYEPAMTGLYKPVSWVGFGIGFGYRLLPLGNRALDANFNYPVYVLKLVISPSAIYHSILKHNYPKL